MKTPDALHFLVNSLELNQLMSHAQETDRLEWLPGTLLAR
jgi:hypothetical protein